MNQLNLLLLFLFATQSASIGDFFTKLLRYIRDIFVSFVDWLRDAFENLVEFIYDAFVWLGELLERLFQALIDVLVSFFEVIYDVIRGLLYLIYMIGVLAVKFFTLILNIGSLAWSFIKGLGRTIASLFYTQRTSGGHGYSQMMGEVVSAMDVLQLNVVAYILLFGIWIMTAFGVLHLISTMRGGGGD